MRKDVKKLADAMEKGWNKLPVMHLGKYFKFDENNGDVIACCALGHTILGCKKPSEKLRRVGIYAKLPVLEYQRVLHEGNDIDLFAAIVLLNDYYKWSTSRIVSWLRSHEND